MIKIGEENQVLINFNEIMSSVMLQCDKNSCIENKVKVSLTLLQANGKLN